ncbi:MAG: hypothetical protein HKP41_01950 [Desulfobacterales bacterium]|nr:hypothetical protein [Deltaproteobacteria bacterium]NNK93092.1 hypothetical protein [Desulfobacterales bacterium]
MFYDKRVKILIGCIPVIICFFALCFVQVVQPQYVLAEFEQPRILKAQTFLKPEVLKGDHYTLDEEVHNDGVLNHYSVNTTFGTVKVISTSSLYILIQEIEAIAAMKKIETDDTAIESLKQSGKNTAAGLKNLIDDPQGTFESAAAGVGSLFNRAKGTIGKREVTGAEDSKVEQLIGFSKSKGQIANQFRVNMYSRNEVLQTELDRLAWADYLGGLGVGVLTSAVPGVGGVILTTSGTARLLNEAINTTPSSELWLQNKNKLSGMGMNEDTIELFLNNPAFSPALQTVLVATLDSMQGVDNLELYVKIALQASNPVMAKILTESAVLTAGYHKNVATLKRLAPMARLARAEKDDGTIVLVLPSDHIIWSEMVADLAGSLIEKAKKSKGDEPEIWALGDFSALALRELEGMGWKVHTNVRSQLMPTE